MSWFQARRLNNELEDHLRVLTSKSYFTACTEIVVYYCWEAKIHLSADWDRMGSAPVVRDSAWNVLFVGQQRR